MAVEVGANGALPAARAVQSLRRHRRLRVVARSACPRPNDRRRVDPNLLFERYGFLGEVLEAGRTDVRNLCTTREQLCCVAIGALLDLSVVSDLFLFIDDRLP